MTDENTHVHVVKEIVSSAILHHCPACLIFVSTGYMHCQVRERTETMKGGGWMGGKQGEARYTAGGEGEEED